MLRLLLAMVATVTVVVFVMVNSHHVALSVVVGPPVKIRLIFLLMLTFILGSLVTAFGGMFVRLRVRRRVRAATAKGAAGQTVGPDEDLLDD